MSISKTKSTTTTPSARNAFQEAAKPLLQAMEKTAASGMDRFQETFKPFLDDHPLLNQAIDNLQASLMSGEGFEKGLQKFFETLIPESTGPTAPIVAAKTSAPSPPVI